MIWKKYGQHFTQAQREAYKTIGGTPHLDWHYTVFGEIVKGIDLIDKLTALKVDKAGNPAAPVWIKVKVLTAKQVNAALK
ncbi:peptidylprolyl isomerase [Mucilaginibacter antarcticus]|uniref:peptidylprolyl isomerase n=1 Tax=Mucilaginibacter antarcticus TaxID=1855725 RepID=UPI003624F6D5